MRTIFTTLALVGFFAAVCSQCVSTEPALKFDFEESETGQMPPQWTAVTALKKQYDVRVVDDGPHSGNKCLMLDHGSVTRAPNDLAAARHKFDVSGQRGRRFRVVAWLRYHNSLGTNAIGDARLRVIESLPGGETGFYDDMTMRGVRSSGWTRTEVLGELSETADSLAIGFSLSGGGTAWLDDLSLEFLGNVGEGDAPAARLTMRQRDNLVAFGRLFGYVRYFHPSDEASAMDWEAFAIAGVERVLEEGCPAGLAECLGNLFSPIAPTLRLSTTRLPSLAASSLLPSGVQADSIIAWRHHGPPEQSQAWIYYSQRVRMPVGSPSDSIPGIGTEVNAALGGGVWCSLPTTLYLTAQRTMPKGAPGFVRLNRPEGWLPSARDRSSRLASAILAWNFAEHFFPYFDVVKSDWHAQLPAALERAALDQSADEFELTLNRMLVHLHDGHGWVTSRTSKPRPDPLPLEWAFVEGRLVVLGTDSTLTTIRRGDEVAEIDGRPVYVWAAELARLRSAATTQHRDIRVASTLTAIPPKNPLPITVLRSSGTTVKLNLVRRPELALRAAQPDSIREIKPGIIYVDLGRISEQDFQRELPRIAQAKGIIFDLRGYPRHIFAGPLMHLTDTTLTSARWHIPIVTRPDHVGMKFDFSNWPVQPVAPRIKGRAAIITDGRAVSAAETLLGIVEHYRLAEIVGQPTAGTNGNIATMALPGGFSVTMTGMKVLKHDGSQHHGVGIRPTVPIAPTIAGIAAGRDELLEKAIEVVSR